MKARFNEITSSEELEQLFNQSFEKPVVFFKHSIACPISFGVYQIVAAATDSDISLVVVQKARNLSDKIAEKTGIKHESPQAIIIKSGKAIYHASHYDITAEDINRNLKSEA